MQVMLKPGIVGVVSRKGIKWLAKADAPLKFNPSFNIDKYSWMFNFIKAIPQAEQNTFKTCQWALKAQKLYKEIAIEENLHFDMVEKGSISIPIKQNLRMQERLTRFITRQG